MQLHPWNTDFTWRRPRRPVPALTAEQVAQFDGDGFVVVPDLVDADVLARGRRRDRRASRRRSTRSSARRRAAASSIAETGAITFATHLVARSPALARR